MSCGVAPRMSAVCLMVRVPAMSSLPLFAARLGDGAAPRHPPSCAASITRRSAVGAFDSRPRDVRGTGEDGAKVRARRVEPAAAREGDGAAHRRAARLRRSRAPARSGYVCVEHLRRDAHARGLGTSAAGERGGARLRGAAASGVVTHRRACRRARPRPRCVARRHHRPARDPAHGETEGRDRRAIVRLRRRYPGDLCERPAHDARDLARVRRTWVLVHSPLVGPSTWSALRDELRARGDRVYAPDLGGDEHDATPLWQQHARPAADALRDVGAGAVLVGHSGAGGLLPAIRDAARTAVGGYIFVDAGLPAPGARKGDGAFAARLDAMHASGRRFPEWTDADLRDVIPDDARRASVLAEMPPQLARFWDEALPVIESWPD